MRVSKQLGYALLIGFVSTSAHAANEHGNGGDVLVCDLPDKQSAEMLDFWEARELRGLEPQFRNIPFHERAVMALMEILPKDQDMGARLMIWADQFMADATFLDNVDLPDINDTGDLLLPNNCVIKQIAIQRTPHTRNDKRYIIDRRLWDKLDDNNKAGLIIHEVIYREALRRGHLNSINVRAFVGLIISKNLNNFDQDSMDLGFREIRYQSEHYLYRLLEDVFPWVSYPLIDIGRNGADVREFNAPENTIRNHMLEIIAAHPEDQRYPVVPWVFGCLKNGWHGVYCGLTADGLYLLGRGDFTTPIHHEFNGRVTVTPL